MNDWLIQQGIVNPQMGLTVGLLLGLLATVIIAWIASRRSSQSASLRLQPEIDELETRLGETTRKSRRSRKGQRRPRHPGR